MYPLRDDREFVFVCLNKRQSRFCRHLSAFIAKLFEIYMDLHFTYLEINPLVVTERAVYVLDLASRLDQTADYLCAPKWGKIEFPPPFGRDAFAEVREI
jgi:ATP citrate (pro-S)-lyase